MVTGGENASGRRVAPLFLSVLLILAAGCRDDSPTQPSAAILTGAWTSDDLARICIGDWHSVRLTLQQSGSTLAGEITTVDGRRISVSGAFEDGAGTLDVAFPQPNEGMCTAVELSISSVETDGGGDAVAFLGEARGSCCGTVLQPYRFDREGPG